MSWEYRFLLMVAGTTVFIICLFWRLIELDRRDRGR
jgi:hypothetical protein